MRLHGENNFKRTINQSYCNFIPKSLNDPLVSHLKHNHFSSINKVTYTLKDPDNDPNLWFSFYQDYQIFKHNPELEKQLYCQFIAKIYEHALHSPHGSLLQNLEEPELGNPIRVFRNERLISQDLVTSVMEYGMVIKYLNDSKSKKPYLIGELGAGYGRLAYVFLKTTNCRYMIFDIPPSLHIAEWYLSSLFPEKRIFKFRSFKCFEQIKTELASADIAFFTPNQLSMFKKDFFDVFITISSLHEMTCDQISHFIKLMSSVTKRIIYIKQYWEYTNHYDNLCISSSEYVLPPKFQVVQKQQDALNPLFFEMLAVVPEPTISILLSTYNDSTYLLESLSGICEQTVTPFEVIIVDDGSTDNSVDIIQSFKEKYPNINIILLRNNDNKGLMYSIDRAFKASSGNYVMWTASDDRLLPNFIETSIKSIELYPEAGIYFSKLVIFEDGTNIEHYYTEDSHGPAFDLGKQTTYLSHNELLTRLQKNYLWISGNTVIAKKSAISKANGFQENLRWHADWFTYYSIALREGVCIIPQTLAMMRQRPNTYSKVGMNNPSEQRKVLTAIIKTLYQKENQDILRAFITCPCLLSPFGYAILPILAKNQRYWRLFICYLNWELFCHQQYHKCLINKALALIKKIWHYL